MRKREEAARTTVVERGTKKLRREMKRRQSRQIRILVTPEFIRLGSIKFAAGRTIIASRFRSFPLEHLLEQSFAQPPIVGTPPPSLFLSLLLRFREFSAKTFVALLIRLIPLLAREETKLSMDRRETVLMAR